MFPNQKNSGVEFNSVTIIHSNGLSFGCASFVLKNKKYVIKHIFV